jgi:hypothetical protein
MSQINIMRLLLLMLAMASLVHAEPEKLWFELGVKSQNVFLKYYLSSVEEGAVMDPSFFEEDLRKLENVFERMIKEKLLLQRIFLLGKHKEIGEGGFRKINRFAIELGEKYGCYTAFEMLGLGVSYRLKTIPRNGMVRLAVRLPESDLVDFEAFLKTNGLNCTVERVGP